jgi:hypothetical protein
LAPGHQHRHDADDADDDDPDLHGSVDHHSALHAVDDDIEQHLDQPLPGQL